MIKFLFSAEEIVILQKILHLWRRLRCKIFECEWKYNFLRLPNKRICARCRRKQTRLKKFEWVNIPFEDSRSDKELIKTWHS